MLSPEQFGIPVKIHFASSAGEDVGSVFADSLAPHAGGISFYFGKSCVALLSESCLLIGTRQLDRGALSSKKPFWYDPAEIQRKCRTNRSSAAELRATA